MDLRLCMSARFNTESQTDTVSITNVMERLDIKLLLERAAQGILDLEAYRAPAFADVVGGASTEALNELLKEPDQPLNHIFGVDKESANNSLQNLLKTVQSSLIVPSEEIVEEDVKDDNTVDDVEH